MTNRSQFGIRRAPHLVPAQRTRADWQLLKQTDDTVWIVDEDLGNMSITNDAEAVAKAVFLMCGDKRIMYRDSEGQWDEISHNQGRFLSYKSGGPKP